MFDKTPAAMGITVETLRESICQSNNLVVGSRAPDVAVHTLDGDLVPSLLDHARTLFGPGPFVLNFVRLEFRMCLCVLCVYVCVCVHV